MISMVVISAPTTRPTDCIRPVQPETCARWVSGTRSAIGVVTPASIAFRPACARHQPRATPATVCWVAVTISPAAPASAPPRIHGRRRPNRLVVRSDQAPASGLTSTATSAPRPVTSESASFLPLGSMRSSCRGNRI